MARLDGKAVLISGASGAIGQAVAFAARGEGASVVTSDLPGRGADLALDVTSEPQWQAAAAEIERRHGRLDGLVNAAGILVLGSVEETDYETFRRVVAVNLDGTFLGCKHMMPLLKRRGGSIVNLSSVSGLVGGHNLAAYNAAKGGVRLLTKSVALAGARMRPPVRANSMHPAFVEGPLVDGMLASTRDPAAAREKMAREVPIGRFASPGEIAALAIYLLADESAFVTGAEFAIDGGLTAR